MSETTSINFQYPAEQADTNIFLQDARTHLLQNNIMDALFLYNRTIDLYYKSYQHNITQHQDIPQNESASFEADQSNIKNAIVNSLYGITVCLCMSSGDFNHYNQVIPILTNHTQHEPQILQMANDYIQSFAEVVEQMRNNRSTNDFAELA